MLGAPLRGRSMSAFWAWRRRAVDGVARRGVDGGLGGGSGWGGEWGEWAGEWEWEEEGEGGVGGGPVGGAAAGGEEVLLEGAPRQRLDRRLRRTLIRCA
jgi:hypothetical protein